MNWIIVGGLAIGALIVGANGTGQERIRRITPRIPIAPVRIDTVCVTRGDLRPNGGVNVPTFRAVLPGTSGEAMAFAFHFRGRSREARALASGAVRRQIGLKLRAANGCNLVYVMWRLDPSPQVEVSIKVNPGLRTHRECGAGGYTKIRPAFHGTVPMPRVGERHQMQAEIVGDELLAWIDGQLVWRGALPPQVRSIQGPSGIRSDNVAYYIEGLSAPLGRYGMGQSGCVADGED